MTNGADTVGKETGRESSLSSWAGPYVTDMLGMGKAIGTQPYQAYTGPLTAGASDLQQTALKKLDLENQWKKLNIINVSIKLPITLSVDSKNYILSEKLEKKLYELDLVSNYYIDSFTNEKIIYKIIYNSTPDKFISEFTSNNFKLNTSNSIWSVE